jgi:hypothetical protein
MAERMRDRKRARATLATAEQALVEWAASNNGESPYDSPALRLAHAALVARKIGYPGANGLLARAIAARSPLGSRYGDAGEGHRTQAQLAILVALADPATGRELIGALLPRLGNIKIPKYDWMEQQIKQDLLCAAALADPARAEAYLTALTKSGAKVSALDAAEFVLDENKRQERLRRTLSIESPEEDQ